MDGWFVVGTARTLGTEHHLSNLGTVPRPRAWPDATDDHGVRTHLGLGVALDDSVVCAHVL